MQEDVVRNKLTLVLRPRDLGLLRQSIAVMLAFLIQDLQLRQRRCELLVVQVFTPLLLPLGVPQ